MADMPEDRWELIIAAAEEQPLREAIALVRELRCELADARSKVESLGDRLATALAVVEAVTAEEDCLASRDNTLIACEHAAHYEAVRKALAAFHARYPS